MGLVTNDLSEWLAEPAPEPGPEVNPFGTGAAHAANLQLHALWHRAAQRLHHWIDPHWDPDAEHEDGLTR